MRESDGTARRRREGKGGLGGVEGPPATHRVGRCFATLEQRRGLLDGVVFSGGEPLAQEATIDAARRAREMGFEVGLHTCGGYPERLERILPHIDWVGIDVKAPWAKYDSVTLARGT